MSRTEDVEVVLSRAEGLEKKYDWLKAVDLYEQVLRAVGKDDLNTISTLDNVKLSRNDVCRLMRASFVPLRGTLKFVRHLTKLIERVKGRSLL